MSVRFKKPNGQIVYRAMCFGCNEYHVTFDTDGYIVQIECVASTVKPECADCSLVNRVRPQYLKPKTAD